jgi:predicted dehydrogenase
MGSTYDEEVGPYSRWQAPHAHAACYRAVEDVELVAGADPHAGQREAFKRKWGLDDTDMYADFHDMLERVRPDIVSVCTTARPRARIVQEVLAAGTGVRAIWGEKPIAISLAEADAMVEQCRERGVLFAIGASRCWDATYSRMRDLIEQGEIGRVLHVNAYARCSLSHNGSHLLTLVSYLIGGTTARCQWVFGQAESDAQAASDDDFAGNGFLQFEEGAQAFVRTTAGGPTQWEIDVLGSEGRLRAMNDALDVELWKFAPAALSGRGQEAVRYPFPRPQGAETAHVRAVRDLVAGIRTGKEPNCNGEAARQALEIAIAIRESHRQGGVRVELPLADRSLRINSAETLHGDEPVAVRRAATAVARAK